MIYHGMIWCIILHSMRFITCHSPSRYGTQSTACEFYYELKSTVLMALHLIMIYATLQLVFNI